MLCYKKCLCGIRYLSTLSILIQFAIVPVVQAEQISLAVASNFINPAKALAQEFETNTGNTIKISSGSTGKLYAQIINGAPFDIFLAADVHRPALLTQSGFAVPESRFTYALGRLALWSANPELIPDDGATLLKSGTFSRLAIANPKTAPYGAAAMSILKNLGIINQVQAKLIRGENIGQTYQYIATGNAELGFTALSQIKDPANKVVGSEWLVPDQLYTPISQQAVLLMRAKESPACKSFLAFLKSSSAKDMLVKKYGYGVSEVLVKK